jgi:hypothetical protein
MCSPHTLQSCSDCVDLPGCQVDKVFRLLGLPQAASWPDLEVLPHWADNSDGCATPRPEYRANRLEEVMLESYRCVTCWALNILGGCIKTISVCKDS